MMMIWTRQINLPETLNLEEAENIVCNLSKAEWKQLKRDKETKELAQHFSLSRKRALAREQKEKQKNEEEDDNENKAQ